MQLKLILLAGAGATCLAGANVSNAADATATQPQAAQSTQAMGEIPEVLVTARKRVENIQAVPISITAFNKEQMAQQGVFTATDLRTQTPSLSTETTSIFSAWPMWGIRGQRDDSFLLLQAPTVITYFADAPQGHPVGFGAALFDIASINVLEGPQGTLFGKNSTGGAVVVTPNRPTDRFEGEIAGKYGNFSAATGEAMLNLPLNDVIQVRLAGRIHSDNGLMANLNGTGRFDKTNDDAGRASILIKPNDRITSLTTVDYYHGHGAPMGTRLFYVNPYSNAGNPAGSFLARFQPALLAQVQAQYALEAAQSGSARWSAGTPFGTGGTTDYLKHPFQQRLRAEGFTNDTTVELSKDVKVRNIISARRDTVYYNGDYNSGNYIVDSTASQENIHQLSEEFQVIGKSFNNRLDWVAGLFYMRETGNEFAGAKNFLTLAQVSGGGQNTAYGLFSQGTLALTNDLKLTLGVRQNRDVIMGYSNGANLAANTSIEPGQTTPTVCKEGVLTTVGASTSVVAFPLASCLLQGTKSFKEPTWNLSLEYNVPKAWLPGADNALVYGAWRRGYRDGGFNMRGTYESCAPTACANGGNFGPYQPEFATDFETGFKGDFHWGASRLRTNLAVYYDVFENLQRSVNVVVAPNPIPQQTIANAAKAHVFGTEFKWMYIYDRRWEFSGFYNLTDAKYDRYISYATSGARLDLSGRGFVDTPKYKTSINFAYNTPLPQGVGQASARVNYTWQDREILAEQPLANGVTPAQSGYGLWNLRLDWRNVLGKPLDVSAYAKNLTGQYYLVGIADLSTSLGVTLAIPGEPRTYGVELRYHF